MLALPLQPPELIGEHHIGIPNNLMPYSQQVDIGKRPELSVFSSDYNTSFIRHYVHIATVMLVLYSVLPLQLQA